MHNSATDTDPIRRFEHERPHLLALAFRILGSDADAQDVVQEAWIRYAGTPTQDVRNLPAWLTTVVARLCLDVLRRRHEVPLPAAELLPPADSRTDPEELALLAAELTEAFTIVLDTLTPPQRVALILHDVFGTPFDEVAHILDTTSSSAKKLASRARGRIRRRANTPQIDAGRARRVVTAFLRAAQHGDVDGLIAVLDPAVTRTADPHVLPKGGRQLIRGVHAVVAEAQTFQAMARRARVATIDERPAIAIEVDGRLRAALVFEIAGRRITHFDVVADPHRLSRLRLAD
jgi:RNA polymerase sigma-70 factor (ECF subfamily)